MLSFGFYAFLWKSATIYIVVPLYVAQHIFCLICFKIVSSSLVLCNIPIMCISLVFIIFSCLKYSELLESVNLVFYQTWEFSSLSLFKYVFAPFSFSLTSNESWCYALLSKGLSSNPEDIILNRRACCPHSCDIIFSGFQLEVYDT